MGDLLILGHRGAAQLPENTVPSFEKALDLGADGFELDVRQTADEKLVVVHGAVVGTLAVQASSYEQIRQLPKGFEIPLLKEVLKKFGRKAFLDIELKTPGFEQAAVDLIRKHCNPAKVLVSGFIWKLSRRFTISFRKSNWASSTTALRTKNRAIIVRSMS